MVMTIRISAIGYFIFRWSILMYKRTNIYKRRKSKTEIAKPLPKDTPLKPKKSLKKILGTRNLQKRKNFKKKVKIFEENLIVESEELVKPPIPEDQVVVQQQSQSYPGPISNPAHLPTPKLKFPGSPHQNKKSQVPKLPPIGKRKYKCRPRKNIANSQETRDVLPSHSESSK